MFIIPIVYYVQFRINIVWLGAVWHIFVFIYGYKYFTSTVYKWFYHFESIFEWNTMKMFTFEIELNSKCVYEIEIKWLLICKTWLSIIQLQMDLNVLDRSVGMPLEMLINIYFICMCDICTSTYVRAFFCFHIWYFL